MTNDKQTEPNTTHPVITQEALAQLGDGRLAYVKTIRSACGRTRSIDSNPFFRSAPSTSMPSASTKVRWNWRAAMPRWRYWRLLSSCCRPRITS